MIPGDSGDSAGSLFCHGPDFFVLLSKLSAFFATDLKFSVPCGGRKDLGDQRGVSELKV